MNEIDNYIESIQNNWEKILPALKLKAKKALDKKQYIINFENQKNDKLPETPGIYLFHIKPTVIINNNNIEKIWMSNGVIKFSPNIILKRVKFEKINKWYPLYIGKTENLLKRINEHCFQDLDKTTYSMKLRHRKKLLKITGTGT